MAVSGSSYDVFLSFRGTDTRYGFIGHLYNALKGNGIRTFLDEGNLKRGDEIEASLVRAIEESRISIIVFSENYASSKWCLDELVKIMEYNRGLVLPVFYYVDPSDVRLQKGIYGEALTMHHKSTTDFDKLNKWSSALRQAATLSGWHFKHGDGFEYELIDKIVDDVSKKINRPVAEDRKVGLEYRLLELNWLLDGAASVGTVIIGIWGMGGIGKTTLARALFDSISDQFNASFFLDGVRENAMKHGLAHLQETVLAQLLGEKDIWLPSIRHGISLMPHMLRRKKVLLVLDDVTESEQLKALVGRLDWFGYGSIVIITTPDRHLLLTHGVQKIYEVEKLTDAEALELLCWKAFKSDTVYPDFVDKLNRVITCASGIPLLVEVIGSSLFGKGIQAWQSTLDRYEKISNLDTLEVLNISVDTLNEHQKEVFLDLACFFNGFKLAEVESILSAHHGDRLKLHDNIRALIDRSLINIDVHGHVKMHDLVQDMGREIVRQESHEHPGGRSRLWYTKDIIRVLEENTGTSKIQIIMLDSSKHDRVVQWDGMAFVKMTNLTTLIIRKECFLEGPKKLPNSLRVLEWWGYPSKSLPSDFQSDKLAILKLPTSCFMPLELPKYLSMKVLNFDKCEFITQIPGLSAAPNLKELSFACCENLVEIHESVGFLDKLETLNCYGCSKILTLPPIKLTSLESINVSNCSSLVSFPEILGKMENITHLSLEYTAISKLPYSIRELVRLRSLELHNCGMVQLPSSIATLPELEVLSIWQCEGLQPSVESEILMVSSSSVKHIDFLSCNILDEFIEIGLAWFANVKELDLSTNNFTILPSCIKECRFLRKLNLDYCIHLQEIGGIPPSLETLSATRCTSLKDLDLTVLLGSTKECFSLRKLVLNDCENLHEIRGIPPSMEFLSAANCRSLTASCRRMLLTQELHEAGNKRFCLPGKKVPEWFEHCSQGQSISFWFRNKFPVISLCVAGLMHKHPFGFKSIVSINGNIMKTEFQTEWFYFELPVLTDHILMFGERQIEFEDNVDDLLSGNEWNHVVVSTKPFVVQTGLHVIKPKGSMDDIQFNDPYKLASFKEKHMVDIGVSQRPFVQIQKELTSFDSLQPHLKRGGEWCSLLQPVALKENQVGSEKCQPSSNELARDLDPMELEYQLSYPEDQFSSNDKSSTSDIGDHVMGI